MSLENDFLVFAGASGSNVVSQSSYAGQAWQTGGFTAGLAQSAQLNKPWRQSSIMAAVLAQFIVNNSGQPAIDDGTTATLLANLQTAVSTSSRTQVILPDTGAANAYAAANPSPMAALPTASGVTQKVLIANTNTASSTYAPDGLAAKPIYGLGGQLLQGNELVTNGIATLVSYVGPLLNSGALCWVLYECIGGNQQVPASTQSGHAVNQGQVLGIGQSKQVLTGSRAIGTNYTNNTGKPILVRVAASGSAAGSAIGFFIDSAEGQVSVATTASGAIGVAETVPAGSVYAVIASGGATLSSWIEYR